jgi:hypothetical protein
MDSLRKVLRWLFGWLFTTGAILAAIGLWVYARGGAFHRTPTCHGPDVNIYAAAILAGAIGLLVVGVYWALGAARARDRWFRLFRVVWGGGVSLGLAFFIGASLFTFACMGGPVPF